jgi:ATP phosphoribosyltransferase
VSPLRIAVPKGRIAEALRPVLAAAGLDAGLGDPADRRLVRDDSNGVRFLFVKPDDVPTYVAYGTAELGVVGTDVLEEHGRDDVYRPLDLGIGRCRIVLAGPKGKKPPPVPRVASRYPAIARRAFAERGIPAEVIPLSGSVELAPATGLADLIVDIADTGKTLRENGLIEREVLLQVTSVVVANRVTLKLDRTRIVELLSRLEKAARRARSAHT